MQSEKYENRWEITLDDFVGVLCRARMSEREAIQLIVEMYRPLMLKYANLNTGFDDDLYQEFVCCVISLNYPSSKKPEQKLYISATSRNKCYTFIS